MVDFNKLATLRLRALLNHEDAVAFEKIIENHDFQICALWGSGKTVA